MATPAESVVAPGARRSAGSRDDIVAAARRVIESQGVAALTMRNVAAVLGVAPTSIYWHIGGRDELVRALIDDASTVFATLTLASGDASSRVTELLDHLWKQTIADRRIAALAHAEGLTSRWAMPLELRLAAELERGGLAGAEVRDAVRSLLSCAGGFLAAALRAESAAPEHGWAELAQSRPELTGAAGLSPTTLAALATPADTHALFVATIGLLVRGLLPDAPSAAKQAPPRKERRVSTR